MKSKWMLKSMDTEKRGPTTCQNHQNITKMVTKIEEKLRSRFLNVFGMAPGRSRGHPPPGHLFLEPFWEPFSTKSHQKGMKKGMQNSISKKCRKLMPKGFQNDAKIDAKIYENSYFSEKG